MNSDIYFGGCAEVMKKVFDFYILSLTNYYERSNIYQPLKFKLIKKCDFDAGKFEWLKYPKKIASNKSDFKDIIPDLKKGFNFTNKSASEPFVIFRKNYESIPFPSEPAFLHYVLSMNFKVKKIQDDILRIHPDRKLLKG